MKELHGSRITFTDNQLQTMKQYYEAGISMKLISELFNVDGKVIARNLRDIGVEIISHKLPRFTDVFAKEICQNYLDGMSVRKLAKLHRTDLSTIYKTLKRYDTEMRENRTYYVEKEDFFETIDTEEKAYWLGFLLTDGYITQGERAKRPTRVGLGLQDRDVGQLRKFLLSIGARNEICYDKSTNARKLLVTSAKMCADLAKYGVVPRKTGRCYKSDLIPKHLERHFWRGCIDGDGCLSEHRSYRSNRKPVWELSLSFAGNTKLCYQFRKFCNGICSKYNGSMSELKSKNGKKYRIIRFSTRQAYNIMVILYEESNFFLTRKFDKYIHIRDTYKGKGSRARNEMEIVTNEK